MENNNLLQIWLLAWGFNKNSREGYGFRVFHQLVVSDTHFCCGSPGPAFNAFGECLGMAFQSLSSESAENIGYVIPTVPKLQKFSLADGDFFFCFAFFLGGIFFDGEMCLEFSISFWEDNWCVVWGLAFDGWFMIMMPMLNLLIGTFPLTFLFFFKTFFSNTSLQVVIMHFLNDLLKHGSYTGFPTIGVETQTMENPHLREAFGMTLKQKGLLVNRIAPTCAVAQLLQVGDVLLSFDKEPIANDGTVLYRKHERVSLSPLAVNKIKFGKTKQLSWSCCTDVSWRFHISCDAMGFFVFFFGPKAGWSHKSSMGKRLISPSPGQHFGISCCFQFCFTWHFTAAAGIVVPHI